MITTEKGIAILESGEKVEEHIKTILRFHNVENIEQLTSFEIKEVNQELEDFKDAVLNPLDVTKIDFHFHIDVNGKLHEIYIGKITKFDMNLTALMQFEALSNDKWNTMPYLIACVYAPVVNAALNLKLPPGTIVQKLTSVFLGMDFKLIYGLYAFFLSFKTASTQKSRLSIQQYGRHYPRLLMNNRKQKVITKNSGRCLRRPESSKSLIKWTGLHSLKSTLKTLIYLCGALGLMRFMRFTMKLRKNM